MKKWIGLERFQCGYNLGWGIVGSLDKGGGGLVEGGQQMLSRGIYSITDSISWSVKWRWRGRIQC